MRERRGVSLPRQELGCTAHPAAKQSRAPRLFTSLSSPAGSRRGSRNRLVRQTPPAPADSLRASPFPQPWAEKLSVHVAGWGGVGESRELVALPLGQKGELAVLDLS